MLWIKTFHILFVIAWLAGLFYLPRIFVHYVEGKSAGEDVHRLVLMARKLVRFSTVMAVVAILLGCWLWFGWWLHTPMMWLHVKLAFVLLLIAYHFQCYRYVGRMRRDEMIHSGIWFRIFNEAALIIVIPILILVVVKPF